MGRYACPPPRLKLKLTIPVYLEYAKTSNLIAVTIYGIMLIGAQTAQIGKLHNRLRGDHFQCASG